MIYTRENWAETITNAGEFLSGARESYRDITGLTFAAHQLAIFGKTRNPLPLANLSRNHARTMHAETTLAMTTGGGHLSCNNFHQKKAGHATDVAQHHHLPGAPNRRPQKHGRSPCLLTKPTINLHNKFKKYTQKTYKNGAGVSSP